jgi:hypothetical protein
MDFIDVIAEQSLLGKDSIRTQSAHIMRAFRSTNIFTSMFMQFVDEQTLFKEFCEIYNDAKTPIISLPVGDVVLGKPLDPLVDFKTDSIFLHKLVECLYMKTKDDMIPLREYVVNASLTTLCELFKHGIEVSKTFKCRDSVCWMLDRIRIIIGDILEAEGKEIVDDLSAIESCDVSPRSFEDTQSAPSTPTAPRKRKADSDRPKPKRNKK